MDAEPTVKGDLKHQAVDIEVSDVGTEEASGAQPVKLDSFTEAVSKATSTVEDAMRRLEVMRAALELHVKGYASPTGTTPNTAGTTVATATASPVELEEGELPREPSMGKSLRKKRKARKL